MWQVIVVLPDVIDRLPEAKIIGSCRCYGSGFDDLVDLYLYHHAKGGGYAIIMS